MNRFRHSPSRRLSALVALLTFVLGTNYCVVSALADSSWSDRVACHAMAKPTPASSHACCGHGAAGNTPARDTGAVTKPCCMSASPVSAPEVAKHETLAAFVTMMALAPDAAASTTTESSRPGRHWSEHPPYLASASAAAPRSPRGPPRS
jgi:hypothetical protein